VAESYARSAAHFHKQYVWGLRYIDAPILRDRETDAGAAGLDERLYYAQDGNFNVTALVNPAGEVVERYSYDAYGRATVRNGAENVDLDTVNDPATEWDADPGNASDVDNCILYCGYRFDSETGLYHVRHRHLHPTLGRWTSQDPLGYVDGMGLYEYVGGNPVRHRDSSGLKIDHYDCCSDKQKAAIKAAHDAAEKKLKVIETAIGKYTYKWVVKNYVLKKKRGIGGKPKKRKIVWDGYRRQMQVNISAMQDEFSTGIGVECEKKCDKGTHAYVYHYNIWSDIHFCPVFFNETAKSQASKFMHELSHLAAWTDDKELQWTRKAGWFTSGGWYAIDAANDAYWFGGSLDSLYNSDDLYRSHEKWLWRKIWPK
jgi:RHS repeat-associated protein